MSVDTIADLDDASPIDPNVTDSRPWDAGRPVREFEAICMKHRLKFGSPDDLIPFQRALDENKQLAMNFWSVVARLGDGVHGPGLSEPQILAAIVRAVSGQEMEQAGESQAAFVDRLGRLLAGEDVSLEAAPSLDTHPGPEPAHAAAEETATALAAKEAVADAAPAQDEIAGPPSERTSAGAGTRLTLQADPPRSLAAAIAAASELEEPAQTPAMGDIGIEQPPDSARRTESPEQMEEEPRIVIPLAAYAPEPVRWSHTAGSAVLAVLFLAALCGGGFVLARNSAALHQTIASWWSKRSAAPAASTPTAAPTINSADTTSGIPAASDTGTPPLTEGPHPASPVNPAAQETQSPTASQPIANPLRMTSRTRDASGSVADADDAARDAALVQVSGEEMRGHLISSRFPIVPDAANADAISGVVTLHAVVTANGTVEHAYALGGPEALRQPAIDAVSSWRYRPYLVDGTPTDVSTTIRVDFSGND